jgi:hypothetical protein
MLKPATATPKSVSYSSINAFLIKLTSIRWATATAWGGGGVGMILTSASCGPSEKYVCKHLLVSVGCIKQQEN